MIFLNPNIEAIFVVNILKPNNSYIKNLWINFNDETAHPITLLGDGMLSIVQILIQLYSVEDGLLLIDEIENGLHHHSLSKLFKLLIQASRETNTQIFIATHSYECLLAAPNEFKAQNDNEFMLYRIEEDRVIDINLEEVDYALHNKWEIR